MIIYNEMSHDFVLPMQATLRLSIPVEKPAGQAVQGKEVLTGKEHLTSVAPQLVTLHSESGCVCQCMYV